MQYSPLLLLKLKQRTMWFGEGIGSVEMFTQERLRVNQRHECGPSV